MKRYVRELALLGPKKLGQIEEFFQRKKKKKEEHGGTHFSSLFLPTHFVAGRGKIPPLILCLITLLCYGSSIYFNSSTKLSPEGALLVLGSSRFLVLFFAFCFLFYRSTGPLNFTNASFLPFLAVLIGNVGA